MKSLLLSLAVATFAVAFPLSPLVANNQYNLEDEYPGFTLDLNAQRLVEVEGKEPAWMTELDKIHMKASGLNFMDITETPNLGGSAPVKIKCTPGSLSLDNTDKVNSVIKALSTEGPRENLEHFTSFRTRYYRSDTGKESQLWLLSKIQEITAAWASKAMRGIVSIGEFQHPWGQNSIIVRINGSSTTDDGIVVIGAHLDSTNMWPFLPAPGADDDGSGSVTILEAYRALIASEFRPVRSVEFHWYSAEEGGLLGSQAVAQAYASRSLNVISMSQFDMTAWVKQGTREEVGIITDYTDNDLTKFNMELVDAYLDIPYVMTKCGYACSDHASWKKAGYPSTFTIESSFGNSNKNIHSAKDRLDISEEFSFEHMLEFSKLAVGIAIELGGWTEPKHIGA